MYQVVVVLEGTVTPIAAFRLEAFARVTTNAVAKLLV